jgi:glutamate-1-semialdehyde 2,1-aminomutase
VTWNERAAAVMPGGVNSPVGAFKAVGGQPPFVARAAGSRIVTTDGAELIDFIASWGALILGHARPEVVEAVRSAAAGGTSYEARFLVEAHLDGALEKAFSVLEEAIVEAGP